jgi:hypothetical protein
VFGGVRLRVQPRLRLSGLMMIREQKRFAEDDPDYFAKVTSLRS